MKSSRSTPRPGSRSAPRSPGEPTPEYSTYPLPELFKRWERDELTDTQMIGHLWQHLSILDGRVRQLEHPPRIEPTTLGPDVADQ